MVPAFRGLFIIQGVGKGRFTVVIQTNNTIINNNTRINFHILTNVNLLLPTCIQMRKTCTCEEMKKEFPYNKNKNLPDGKYGQKIQFSGGHQIQLSTDSFEGNTNQKDSPSSSEEVKFLAAPPPPLELSWRDWSLRFCSDPSSGLHRKYLPRTEVWRSQMHRKR